MRVAVIDLGTFSAILLIAESKRGRLVPLHEARRTVDLEYSSGNTLAPSGLKRAADAMHRFDRVLREFEVDRGLIVATAALRHATNRSAVLLGLRKDSRLPVRVLTTKNEAEYSARGAVIGLPRVAPSSLVIDIGGGSSEFIVAKTGIMSGLPTGAAWATREWSRSAPRGHAKRDLYYLAAAEKSVIHLNASKFGKVGSIVGLGGTITTLAAIKHRMQEFDVKRVHGTTLSRDWIDSLATVMSSMPETSIRHLVPFDPSRARVLLAGTYLWSAVLNRLNADRVMVSARGLRWGVAAHLAGLP